MPRRRNTRGGTILPHQRDTDDTTLTIVNQLPTTAQNIDGGCRSILHNSLLLFVYYFCSTTTSTVSYATGGCRYFALITTHLVHLHRFGHHAIGRCIKKSITGIHQPP
jgi:hypothetical protein